MHQVVQPMQLLELSPSFSIMRLCNVLGHCTHVSKVDLCKDKDKDKVPFIGPQEFVVVYSKAPKQPQSSAIAQ